MNRNAVAPGRLDRSCRVAPVLALTISWILGFASGVPADEIRLAANDLSELTLEQLNHVQITSVSRRAERLSEVAGSVYVLTAEDIRRSGAQTLPELLRLVPTLQVARADANQYAISARGFNSVLANKMLVLIDGRTVYSPLFSGVFWEAEDLVLEDIERVEVLSGPGGTSWGTNAVNGIINIITRSAADSRGVIASGGGGDELRMGEARAGFGGPKRHSAFRAWGKYADQEHSELADGDDVRDASHRFLGGLRGRWARGASTWVLDGGGIRNRIEQVPDERDVSSFHALGRWVRQPARGAGFRLQVYYQRDRRGQPGTIDDVLDTWDAELQHEVRGARQTLVWGAGYRFQRDRAEFLSPFVAFVPEDRDLTYFHGFAEDELHLGGHLELTAGVRVEHNVFTGYEPLPTLRAAWNPGPHLLWIALSRAVRAPARVDRDLVSPAPPLPPSILAGGPDFRSELAHVAEIGYRAQPLPAFSYSVTGFYSAYDRLRSLEASPSGFVFANGLEGETHGVEAWANYRVTSRWRLSAGGLAQNRDIDVKSGHTDINGRLTLGDDPHHQWQARSSFDIGRDQELDVWVRQVGDLAPTLVPAYTTLDARAATRLPAGFQLSLTGYNLAGPAHPEWGAGAVFGRALFAQLEWRH
jgi:iron complex outermembrane recepter protein